MLSAPAIERALRPAQHLDPGNVEEVKSRAGRTRIVDIVDVDPDALLDPIIGQPEWCAQPADVGCAVARI
jgi:hypothetical protein